MILIHLECLSSPSPHLINCFVTRMLKLIVKVSAIEESELIHITAISD
jgi:hypothetical protein